MFHADSRTVIVLMALMLILFSSHGVLAKSAKITDLGTLPGDTVSLARAINDLGVVVGESTSDGSFETNCFIKRDDQLELLNSQPSWKGNCVVSDVNDNGEVVGRVIKASGAPESGFVWRDGVMNDLGFPSDYSVTPRAINNNGQIVGEFCAPSSWGGCVPRGFVWQNGSYTQLPCQAVAVDNNDAGQVLALNLSSCPPAQPNYPKGMLWDNDAVTDLDFNPVAINNDGKVVGVKYLANSHTFVLWQNGTTSNLDIQFYPMKINDLGEIVGRTEASPETAMFWKDGLSTELSSFKKDQRIGAFALNNTGQVVGYDVIDNEGRGHAVIWTQKRMSASRSSL